MLLHLDACMQRLRRVILKDRNRLLDDDRPGVRARIDEVHGDARHLAAVVQRLRPAVDARKRGQQRRMNVQHPVRERRQQLRFHDAHEAGEGDRIDARVLQELDALVFGDALKLRLPRRAVEILTRDVVLLRPFENLRVREVRQDQLNLRVQRSRLDRIDD